MPTPLNSCFLLRERHFWRVNRAGRLRLALAMATLSSSAFPLLAQEGPLTQDQVGELLADKRLARERILSLSENRCLSFVVDTKAAEPLLAESHDSALVAGLRNACYIGSALQISADRPGTAVRVGGQSMGVAPWTGPVQAAGRIEVEVHQGTWSQSVAVTVPTNRIVKIAFHVPADTAVIPPAPSDLELARLAADTALYVPRTPRPLLPRPPVPHSTLGLTLVGGIVGAAAAAGTGAVACKSNQYVPLPYAHGYDTVGTAKQTSVGCTAATGAAGLLAGGLLGQIIGRVGNASRERAYDWAKAGYPMQVTKWEAQNTTDSAVQISENKTKYQEALTAAQEATAVANANAAIRSNNAMLKNPEITVESAPRLAHAYTSTGDTQ